jgi:uncharacterized protein (DUF3820 family)
LVLSYGKYRGWDLEKVPRDYLQWLLNNNGEVIAIVEAEIQKRDRAEVAESSSAEPAGQASTESAEQCPEFLRYGKHSGKNLKDVPGNYLEWLLTSNRETVAAVEAELQRREIEAENIIGNGFQPVIQQQAPEQPELIAEVKKCPSGAAKNSDYNPTWLGGAIFPYSLPPADLELAKRLAREEFHPWESAILDVVLNRASAIAQKDLEAAVLKMGVLRWRVAQTAQMLARAGKIVRKKIGRQWHYSKPGLHPAKGDGSKQLPARAASV